jgi:Gluconate 2-dehydrogenase subunit 3
MVIHFSRREILRLMAAAAAGTMLPARRGSAAPVVSEPTPSFLSSTEAAILEAAAARIVPGDDQPGARECGAADYIQNLLSFMPGSDANCDRGVNAADMTATVLAAHGHRPGCPLGGDADGIAGVDAADAVRAASAVFNAQQVYAGGPFSDRQPQPHFPTGTTPCYVCHGAPLQQVATANGAAAADTVDNYAPNFFTQFLPLSRLQALSWKIRILGADAVPEAAQNPLARDLPESNLRGKYRDGLAALESASQQQFGKSFVQLTAAQQTTALSKVDQDFVTLLTAHTIEGMLCAPEYGGNRDRLGWQLVRFDGDSQPLGYEIYDETLAGYRERPDKPNSGPNPDEDCRGFSANMNNFLRVISSVDLTRPNRRFPNPYCFDVPT